MKTYIFIFRNAIEIGFANEIFFTVIRHVCITRIRLPFHLRMIWAVKSEGMMCPIESGGVYVKAPMEYDSSLF